MTTWSVAAIQGLTFGDWRAAPALTADRYGRTAQPRLVALLPAGAARGRHALRLRMSAALLFGKQCCFRQASVPVGDDELRLVRRVKRRRVARVPAHVIVLPVVVGRRFERDPQLRHGPTSRITSCGARSRMWRTALPPWRSTSLATSSRSV